MDRLIYVLLGVWAFLFGLMTVTNFAITWDKPIMGFFALATGVVCLVRAIRQV